MILPSEEEIEKKIREAVKNLKPEDILNAMKSGKDVFDIIFFNHLHKILKFKPAEWLIKLAVRRYWRLIEKYLANVKNLYDLLLTNPQLRPLLRRRDVINWLNKQAEIAYRKLYNFAWE